MNKKINKIIDFCLSFIYPERCAICDDVISYEAGGICAECIKKIKLIDHNRCYKCGKQLMQDVEEYCHDCKKISHNFDRGYSLFTYAGDIKESIYRFKYANRRRYAKFYGDMISKELYSEIKSLSPDALIPVPIHKKRLKKRGYNQAELIADEIGLRMGIPVLKNYIIRTKYTKPLKLLSAIERQNNLKKAFKIAQNDVKLESIVIVDDIYTTGSTVDEISGILKGAGVKKVYFVSLASGYNI